MTEIESIIKIMIGNRISIIIHRNFHKNNYLKKTIVTLICTNQFYTLS